MLVFAAAVSSDRACSVCGCSLSSDWTTQDYATTPGLSLDVRFEYFDQSQLHRGTHTVNRADLAIPNDDEIQQDTINRSLWLDLDDVLNDHWALDVQFPAYDRTHSTIAAGDTSLSTSRGSGLGDLRLIGRHQVVTENQSFSFQLGLKLPTGRYDQTFATGPQAGEILDRGLQLGTGTVDLLAGLAWFVRPANTLGCFAQLLVAHPLDSRDGFRPSPNLNLNGGLRWLNTSVLTPQLQMNVRWEGRESGVNSDATNSGGTSAFLSPGLTVALGSVSSAFAFVQLPVYQRVNGLQLLPRWLFSAGFRCKW